MNSKNEVTAATPQVPKSPKHNKQTNKQTNRQTDKQTIKHSVHKISSINSQVGKEKNRELFHRKSYT
jgi:hypothetical protein